MLVICQESTDELEPLGDEENIRITVMTEVLKQIIFGDILYIYYIYYV